jgi:hypothetical protein
VLPRSVNPKEFFTQGEGDGTAKAVVNQQWANFFTKKNIFFFALMANFLLD